ncbi:hypothetical protein KI387_032200, partial [Taxus chinensis]
VGGVPYEKGLVVSDTLQEIDSSKYLAVFAMTGKAEVALNLVMAPVSLKMESLQLSMKNFRLKTKQQELLLRLGILCLVYVLTFITRLFNVLCYESMIREFDLYFNYRTTLYLTKKGFYEFWIRFDYESWYPLGRIIGETLYPNLMVTAALMYWTLRMLSFAVHIRELRGGSGGGKICEGGERSERPRSMEKSCPNPRYSHILDYENIAFRCRICRNIGHLQASCPYNKNKNSTKHNGSTSSSGWGTLNLKLVSASKFKDDPRNPTTEEIQENGQVAGGTKRGHLSENLESDWDSVSENLIALVNPNDLVL